MLAVPFTTPAGRDIIAAGLPGGEIYAVTIDNPTGSWLYLPGIRQRIPPYTLGWAQFLDNPVASFDVTFAATGPDGTKSTLVGDPLLLTLYDFDAARQRQIATSIGVAYVPLAHKRIVVGTMPVGLSLTNIGFTGADAGRIVRSIQVDNPSQAWLLLGTYGDKIPPSTMGWSKVLPDGATSPTITATTGADGSPSIELGDPPSLTIYDDASAGNSAGSEYVPLPRMRKVTAATTATNTVNFGFIGADAGRLIAVASIDNPSGQWLSVAGNSPSGVAVRTDYVPPFTLGRRIVYAKPMTDITVTTGASPAGQISTSASGDPYTLTILDAVSDQTHSAFITGYTPGLNASGSYLATTGLSTAVTLAAVPGKRYRILAFGVATDFVGDALALNADSPSIWRLQAAASTVFLSSIALDPSQPSDMQTFPDGLDVPVNTDVTIRVTCAWARVQGEYLIQYELI